MRSHRPNYGHIAVKSGSLYAVLWKNITNWDKERDIKFMWSISIVSNCYQTLLLREDEVLPLAGAITDCIFWPLPLEKEMCLMGLWAFNTTNWSNGHWPGCTWISWGPLPPYLGTLEHPSKTELWYLTLASETFLVLAENFFRCLKTCMGPVGMLTYVRINLCTSFFESWLCYRICFILRETFVYNRCTVSGGQRAKRDHLGSILN